MTAPPDDTKTGTSAIVAALRSERDAALAREAALAEALTTRNSEFGERIEQQSATIDVLKVMSASPGDPLPVFDLIANRASAFCEADGAMVTLLEGGMLHLRTHIGATQAASAAYEAYFPCPVDDSTTLGRAVLTRAPVHNPDLLADPRYRMKAITSVNSVRSNAAVPILRGGVPIGAIGIAWLSVGEFPTAQLELLKTFAEQAVIAITSAEIYRALQTRTADLQESLEYQTATSEVLNVISRSTFDLQPVLTMVAETAARLCAADQAVIIRHENGIIEMVANSGFPPEYEARLKKLGPHRLVADAPMVTYRAISERRVVHIHDVAAVSGYAVEPIELGQQRTSLGVPLMRAGEPIGSILLARRRVEPFTDRQIELVNTFANQAVIAIENTRLLTEQQEALEQQTATTEVLQVINASPGNLAPVFEAMLEKATRLCDSSFGTLVTYDGEYFNHVAGRGVPPVLAEFFRLPIEPSPGMTLSRVVHGEDVVQVADITDDEVYRSGNPARRALADLGGARTQLLVALRKDGALLGVFNIFRQDVRLFSEKQVALLQNFAAQAVIAMENARLLDELRERTAALAERNSEYSERIAHQSATIDVLKEMSASPGDPRPVFDQIVRRAQGLCNSTNAVLFEYDGEMVHCRAMTSSASSRDELDAYMARFPMPLRRDPNHIHNAAILDGRIVHVRDTTVEEGVSQAAQALGVRSGIAIPLIRDEAAAGCIVLANYETGGYSDTQIELLKTFAEQAVIAMRGAETFRALQTRTSDLQESLEYQTATSDVLKVISRSTFDLQPVLETVVRTATRLCDAEAGVITSREAAGYRVTATFSMNPEYGSFLRGRLLPVIRGNITGRTALEGGIVHIEDIEADPEWTLHEATTLEKGRTMLGVPLLREGVVTGTINLARRAVRPFTDKQIELVSTFADQAVIAIENTRLLTEQQEALEQQTATADVLRVINSSPGDLAPVFDAILEKAHTLCGASQGSLVTYDGEFFRAVASRGLPEKFAALLSQLFRPNSRHQAMLGGERLVHIRDVKEVGPGAGDDITRGLVEMTGVRTLLQMPLRKDGTLLGYINTSRNEVRPFSEKEIALLENFAAQAVIAMENARLLGELRQRTGDLQESLEYQTATSEVLKVISRSTFDLDPVFQAVVTTAVRLCRADQATIYRYQDGDYRWAAGFGLAPDYERIEREVRILPGTGTLVGRVALEGRMVQIIDAWTDPLYEAKEDARVGDVHTMLGVPLLRDGVPIGVIGLARRRIEPYTERQIELVSTFAEQGVIAIGSVATFQALQERTAELTRSVAELQALEEVLRAVNSSLDLDTVLATIISRAAQLSQADEGTIYEYNEAEEVFVPKAAFGMTEERVSALRERRVRLGETHLGRAAVQRAPVHISDVQQDPSMPGAGELLHGIHAVLAVPLLRDDNVVGGLVIRRRTAGGFAPTIPTLLQTFAGQAVLAIENAQLFQDSRRARATAEAALVDLRRTQDRLVQTEKMASLGQLTAGIAHEIKNPLNFVNNFSDLSVDLLDELHGVVAPDKLAIAADLRAEIDDLTATLKGNLEKIAQHGRRADSIVKNMLLHSRSGPSEHRAIDLNTTVEEALNLAYHGARAQDQSFNISLERDFGEGIATIELSPQDMTRVLLNLFSNGFYAARKRQNSEAESGIEPVLKVTTRDLGDAAEIRVWDNGTGIPADIRDKLFQPFFTTKPTGEGTGLGLSISYDVVTQQHGGTITVESEVGAYTEFTITIPRLATAVSDDHRN